MKTFTRTTLVKAMMSTLGSAGIRAASYADTYFDANLRRYGRTELPTDEYAGVFATDLGDTFRIWKGELSDPVLRSRNEPRFSAWSRMR